MKKKSVVMFALIFALTLSFIALDGPASAKELKIGMVCANMAADSNVAVYDAFQKYAADKSWTLVHDDAQGDIARMSPGIINFVNQGVMVTPWTDAE